MYIAFEDMDDSIRPYRRRQTELRPRRTFSSVSTQTSEARYYHIRYQFSHSRFPTTQVMKAAAAVVGQRLFVTRR